MSMPTNIVDPILAHVENIERPFDDPHEYCSSFLQIKQIRGEKLALLRLNSIRNVFW